LRLFENRKKTGNADFGLRFQRKLRPKLRDDLRPVSGFLPGTGPGARFSNNRMLDSASLFHCFTQWVIAI